MTTAAAAPEPVSVDTNVLVFAAVPAFPWHAAAVTCLSDLDTSGAPLWISRQTLREYLSALSRPSTYTPAIPISSLLADIPALVARFLIIEDGPAVTATLLTLLETVPCGREQVYDANIVATMLAGGIRRIVTHNVSDFRRFSAFIDILPLVGS